MTLQVLVSAMHQNDYSLLQKMNIQSDAIVVNQCDRDEIERFEYNGHSIVWMSLNERGVGLSRNTALMRSTADIILFADEDVCYTDGYPKLVVDEFEKTPHADMIVFDMRDTGDEIIRRHIKKKERVRIYSSLRHGTLRFACRRESIFKEGISFHLLFGGGARYSSGEDCIFITDVLKRHLTVYACPKCLGEVHQENSTWFKGFDRKFFYDKGVLMGTIFGILAYPFTAMLIAKNKYQTREYGLKNALLAAFRGIREG